MAHSRSAIIKCKIPCVTQFCFTAFGLFPPSPNYIVGRLPNNNNNNKPAKSRARQTPDQTMTLKFGACIIPSLTSHGCEHCVQQSKCVCVCVPYCARFILKRTRYEFIITRHQYYFCLCLSLSRNWCFDIYTRAHTRAYASRSQCKALFLSHLVTHSLVSLACAAISLLFLLRLLVAAGKQFYSS